MKSKLQKRSEAFARLLRAEYINSKSLLRHVQNGGDIHNAKEDRAKWEAAREAHLNHLYTLGVVK